MLKHKWFGKLTMTGLVLIFSLVAALYLFASPLIPLLKERGRGEASAKGVEGCGAVDCTKCHSINKQDVEGVFKKLNAAHIKILNIQMSPVKGLWEVSVEDKGQRGIIYVDFSKNYILSGSIIAARGGANVTQQKAEELEKQRRVDVSKIPIKDAIIMGDPKAAKKVIMFTDPG